MTPLLRSPLVASILLLGCVPLPESLGEGLTTSDGGDPSGHEGTSADSSDEAGSSDGAEVDPEPKLELLLEPDTRCTDLAIMPDGGAVVLVRDTSAEAIITGRRLRRYAADGTLLWQRPDGTEMLDMVTLPDGRIVVGGSVSDAPRQAALWLLSPEGAVEATYLQPIDGTGDDALVAMVAADASGVAFIVLHIEDDSPSEYEPSRYELAFAGPDLVPQWWSPEVDAHAASLQGVQIAAWGSVRTFQLEHETSSVRMRTFSATGVLESDEEVPPWSTFAGGEPGVLVGYDDIGLHVTGLDEAPELGEALYDVTLGGWPDAYHQGGVFIGVTAPGGEGIWVSRLDVDGTQLYQRVFEPIESPLTALDQIAPGPDESVYLCGVEFEGGFVEPRGFLSRRYPLW